jgi:regulatory protein
VTNALTGKTSRKGGWRKAGARGTGGDGPGGDESAEPRRRARPLDASRLDELALAYVARFATSAAKLADYLARKLRERGWDQGEDTDAGGAEAAIAAIVARCVAAGYVDDAGYARARAGGLLRRGYGKRRIAQAMGHAGIEAEIAATVLPDAAEARAAALLMARRRRFGPFGRGAGDAEDEGFECEPEADDPRAASQAARAKREREIAAMLRAGHPLDIVRELLDAANAKAAERWAQEPM